MGGHGLQFRSCGSEFRAKVSELLFDGAEFVAGSGMIGPAFKWFPGPDCDDIDVPVRRLCERPSQRVVRGG